MSLAGSKRHLFVLALAAVAAATIAACDNNITQPDLRVAPTPRSSIDGDTSQCTRGWVVVQGHFECL
jgi:hypothetical protein